MTIPQAVELLRGCTPEDVSAEQVDGLSELIERTPACVALLGGQSRVDLFLKVSRQSLKQRDAAESCTAAVVEPTDIPPVQPTAEQRHLVELGVLAAGVLIAAVLGCVYFFGFPDWIVGPRELAPKTTPASVKQAAVDQSSSTPGKKKRASRSAPTVHDSPPGPANETWKGWRIESSLGAFALSKTVWSIDDPTKPEAATVLVLGSQPSTLSSEKQIDADHRWLRIELLTAEAPATGTLFILVDGKTVSQVKLEPALIGAPLLASLEEYQGRKVKVEIRYEPDSTAAAIAIKTLSLSGQSTRVPWTSLKPLTAVSDAGATLAVLPDDSVLATGGSTAVEAYHVTAALPSQGATAIRLDALPDASLPKQGPGRSDEGQFLLYRVTAARTASIKKLDQIPARYVRIELFGPPRALTLAEVEVFSGGQNVARRKKATQSSVAYSRHAGLAVDGNTRNEFKRGSVTHTAGEANGWWAVDLGQEYPIEKIIVWNRGDGCHQELANHRIVVSDAQGKIRWQHENPFAPLPNVTYGPFVLEEERLAFSAVAVDGSSPGSYPGGMIKDDGPTGSGWTGRGAGQVSTAVFTLQEPLRGGEQITLHLIQGSSQAASLGRFRVWSTAAPGPHQSEPAVIILPTAH